MTLRHPCSSTAVRSARSPYSRSRSVRNRGRGRSDSLRGSQAPGTLVLPSSLLLGSFHQKKQNQTQTDCINDAIAVLRASNRRKHHGKEHQQQRLDDSVSSNDSSSSEESGPLDPNETKKDDGAKTSPIHDNVDTLSHRSRSNNGWEWKIGILPPAPGEERYARRSTLLFSEGTNYNNNNSSSFLSGLSPSDFETHNGRISIRHRKGKR